MKLKMFKSFINTFIVIVPTIAIASPLKDSFTADMIQKADEQQITGKIYVKGNKYRMDITTEGEEISILVNPETGKRYIISHSQKTAREIQNTVFQSLSINPFESAILFMEQYDSREVSFDTINGYDCKKNQIYEKEKKLMTIWTSDKLYWPIKIKTEDKPPIEAELKNIKEESLNNSLFTIPEGYKITSSFGTKKKNGNKNRIAQNHRKKALPVRVKPEKPVDIASMKEVIFKKLEQNNIKRETKDGQIKLEPVAIPVLKKFFPNWKIFSIIREKQIREETLFSYIPVEKAAVNKDNETVCIISSPATDMPLKSGFTIVQSENIKLKDKEEFKEFANALDALYFKDSKFQGIDSLGNNKWAIYTGTFFEYLTGFLVKVDSTGEVVEIKYSLKIKEK